MKTSTLSLFLYSLLLIAGMGMALLSSAQERQMGGVGISGFADKKWSDIISSLRRVDSGNISPGDASQSVPYIVLFAQPNYRRTATNFSAPVSSLRGSKRRVGSVTIERGVWQLCQGNHFTGRCVTLDQSVPDLSTHNMRNRVSSLRPVR